MKKLFPTCIEVLEARIAPAVTVLNLSSIDGKNGFKLSGVLSRDYAGTSVSDAGDINGDGIDDVIVGAYGAEPNGDDSGASYVVFGKLTGFPANLSLSALDGSNGFRINGVSAYIHSGRSVSAAGDLNGDGIGDLIIGAPKASPNGSLSGAAYVVFGKTGGFAASLNLSTLTGANGFKLSGSLPGEYTGQSVSAAGDVNGDGFDDVIIGAHRAGSGSETGAGYVVFGKANGFSANLNLAALDGSNGFKFIGAAAGDAAGRSVSAAGDINHDGFDDVIIGANNADPNGSSSGAAYVILGKASGFAASLNLSSLVGSNGFRLSGTKSAEQVGVAVSAAGDLNGDGIDDLVVGGATNYDGSAYVVFGKTDAFAADLKLGALNGTDGFVLKARSNSIAGFSVSGAGDFNGDGFDDLLIGGPSNYGGVYVVYGKAAGFGPSVDLAALDGANGFKVQAAALNESVGRSVSTARDVNGDGFSDLIVGAPRTLINGVQAGAAYVIFGSALGPLPSISVNDLTLVEPLQGTLSASFTIALSSPSFQTITVQYATADGSATAPDDYTAQPLSTLTFLPGEITKTVSISIFANFPREPDETFFVNLSNPTNSTISDSQGLGLIIDKSAPTELSALNGTNGFTLKGVSEYDLSGFSVSSAGDVNGDGFDDVIVGAPNPGLLRSFSGASYVVFGKAGGFAKNLDLSALNGTNGFKLNGVAGNKAGSSVSTAGDLNGDGFDDLIIGAPSATANGASYSGLTYVVFGKASSFGASLNLSALNGNDGFKLSGSGGERFGTSVSSAGDINSDGFDDIIIGARNADLNGTDSGAAYLLFGKASGFASNLNVSTLNGSNGFKLIGGAAGNYAGYSVHSAGDVNNDGFSDIIIGAPFAATTSNGTGASYVVFGKASAFSASINLSALNGSNGFKLSGVGFAERSGYSVSNAGDFNGDGFDDVLIGAPRANANGKYSGVSYVVFGKASGFAANMSLSSLNGTNGFKLNGVATYDQSGRAVSAAGDVNGDGFADLLIGTGNGLPPNLTPGVSYLIFGKPNGFPGTFNLSTLDGGNGYKINGVAASDYAGSSVSAAGDVNGDGFGDLIIGAHRADSNGVNAGAAYVVFGHGAELRVGNATILEGEAGINALQFTVALSEPAELPVSVKVSTANGSAHAGVDYTALTLETITFAPGETSKTVTVNGIGDTTFEKDESFSLVLSDAKGGLIKQSTGIGTIQNDDSPPLVSIIGGSVLEGDTGTSILIFTAKLSVPSGLPVSVHVASTDGTAVAGGDYTALTPELLTFQPGELIKTIAVAALGDLVIEDHESFSVVLSEAAGATIGEGVASGTILNDDTALSISDAGSVLEGNSGAALLVFNITLDKASALPVSVRFATLDGTAIAGSDYTAIPPDLLTFQPGEIIKTITVEALGDTLIEDHESFSLVLAGPVNATISQAAGIGTILNEDTAVAISDAGSVLEGDSGSATLLFNISLEKPSALPVTVNFANLDGSAVAGSDYTFLSSGVITFAPGETTKTLTAHVLGDTLIEDHENFSIELSDASNALISRRSGAGIILNDDTALRIENAVILEGDSGTAPLVFTVSLEKASALPVTVNYTSADGTAKAGSDFTAPSGDSQITFAPGEITKMITIGVTGDTAVESHENFIVLLSGALNAVIATSAATGTILNDETLLEITDVAQLEGHFDTHTITFTVNLASASALPVSVSFASHDGTAIGGMDYMALSPGMLEFAPGETSKTIALEILGDTSFEMSETFSILLENPLNAVIAKASGLGTILNDDVTLINPHKVAFTDSDGELVTVLTTRGTLKVENFTIVPSGLGSYLALIDLNGEAGFTSTNLSVTAKAARGIAPGDHLAHVGYLNATGINLGKLIIKGDLGRIEAGDGLEGKPALLSLNAHSIGKFGILTQLPGGSLQSNINGTLNSLNLAENLDGATLSAAGDIGSVIIKGDMRDSAIHVDGKIRAVKIAGNLVSGADGVATISARGILEPASASKAMAIASIRIGGSVDHAQILAGYDRSGAAVNSEASIGSVSIGANWLASSLVAGALAGPDQRFGTDDDGPISPSGTIVSKIASIVIKGTATGSVAAEEGFGFVAREIGSFKTGKAKLALTRGPENDLTAQLVGLSSNLSLREI